MYTEEAARKWPEATGERPTRVARPKKKYKQSFADYSKRFGLTCVDFRTQKRYVQVLKPFQRLGPSQHKEILNFTGINIGFTFDGLNVLGAPNLNNINDAPFTAGLATRSASLGDPISAEGSPNQWVMGAPGQDLHGLMLITGPNESSVTAVFNSINALATGSWNPTFFDGKTRGPERGHELCEAIHKTTV